MIFVAPIGFYATLVAAHLYVHGFDGRMPAAENEDDPDARVVV